jgi:uncharacterized membrane protein YqjE
MAIAESLARMGRTLLGVIHTRLELISVEVEEELVRLASYLVLALIALFCGGIALLLLILFVVVLFWDSYRTEVLCLLILLFGGAAAGLGWYLRRAWRNKPRLLAHSLSELREDARTLQGDSDDQD